MPHFGRRERRPPPTTALRRRLALCGFVAAQLGMVLIALGLPGIPLLLWLLMGAQFRLAMRDAPYRSRRPSKRSRSAFSLMKPAASLWS